MSVEPPPPDWVRSDTAFHPRRSILAGEETRRTRSSPRVVLESVPHAPILEEPVHDPATGRDRRTGVRRTAPAASGAVLIAAVRKEWENFAFTTLRRSWLIACLGFVVVAALAAYGWQRGTLSGMAAGITGERAGTDGAPAAPRLSSDQVAWTETSDADDDERRSTASFASDRAFADESNDEPTSGAKLFATDGKKSSKSATADDGVTAGNTGDPSRRAPTGSGSGDPLDADAVPRKRTETTEPAVRYENCAEAAAAGAAPIRLGEPGYRLSLDQDKDGVACENGSTPEDPGDAPVDSLYSNPTTTTAEISDVTTTSSGTGAGTTSTAESTGTSSSSSAESSTTTTRSTTESSHATSTTTSTTTSSTARSTTVSTVTTNPTTSTTSASSSTSLSSSTTTTSPSTTSTTATTVLTTTSSTTTASTTIDLPPIGPIRAQFAVSAGRP